MWQVTGSFITYNDKVGTNFAQCSTKPIEETLHNNMYYQYLFSKVYKVLQVLIVAYKIAETASELFTLSLALLHATLFVVILCIFGKLLPSSKQQQWLIWLLYALHSL